MRSNSGFTLVELSIVVLVIGLVVGGIMIGQEVLRTAELRAQIKQITNYNNAANAFQLKYKYYPGDLPSSEATTYGFFAETTNAYTRGHQDGNGKIEGGAAGSSPALGETLGFWRHLSDAQMISGSFGTAVSGSPLAVNTGGAATAALTASAINGLLPPGKLTGNQILVFTTEDENFFQILGIYTISPVDGSMTARTMMTPLQAQNIDLKMDDTFPLTGKVRAQMFTNAFPLGTCVIVGNVYEVGANGNTPRCALAIRFD